MKMKTLPIGYITKKINLLPGLKMSINLIFNFYINVED